MFEKINGKKFTLLPKTPKENKVLCEHCGGTGWLIDINEGCIEYCRECGGEGTLRTCKYCGEPLPYYSCGCRNTECEEQAQLERQEIEKQKELERVKKAKHYTLETAPKESIEVFYSEDYDYNDGYFNDIETVKDYKDCPKYVWGTTKIPFTLDCDYMIEIALEESYDGVEPNVDDKEVTKLQKACDEFVKAHNGALDSCIMNYNVCIDL